MNLLIDAPPLSVWVGGGEYEINSDFRTSVLFELLMQDQEVDQQEKYWRSLELYYPIIPDDTDQAAEALVWFYQCGKEQRESEGSGRNQRIYSFDCDDSYIYAAFQDQYRIDLTETRLHWWKFRALFLALSEDTMIRKIMGYRAIDITSDMSEKEQEFYRAMKEQYRIPLPQSEQDKIDAIEEALLNGGDLTGLL